MGKRGAAAQDRNARRPGETHLQWRSRIASIKQNERDRSEPIVPQEAQRHGNYVERDVLHIETFTLATAFRNELTSPLSRLRDKGDITEDQYAASLQIAYIAEMLERAASVRCASLEARVDNSGGSHDLLIEKLGAVRMEAAYTAWRQRLPMPRRMVIDMLTSGNLVATARRYNTPWRRARKILIAALDVWADECARSRKVEQRDVDWIYQRLNPAAAA